MSDIPLCRFQFRCFRGRIFGLSRGLVLVLVFSWLQDLELWLSYDISGTDFPEVQTARNEMLVLVSI